MRRHKGELALIVVFGLFLLTAFFITNNNNERPKEVLSQYEQNTQLLIEVFSERFEELGIKKLEHSTKYLPGGTVVSFRVESSPDLDYFLMNDPNIKVVDSFDNVVQLEYSARGYERAFELHYPWEDGGTMTLIVHNMDSWR